MSPVLRLENVTKRYGQTLAVDGVAFTAEPGRLFGLLGPNGAGKTSTIRMIAHITSPDAGTITLGGEPVSQATQRRMGYLPEERGLYRRMHVGEQLVYLGRLKGMTARDAETTTRRWLDRFDASGWYGKKVEELSKGMQQKVQFVATVMHGPDLVILDEPFSGLDPINADLLQETVSELRADGRTVLFASHRMEQVEQLCDDLCLLARGRVVLSGALREVKRRFGRDTASLHWGGDGAFLDRLAASGDVSVLSRTGSSATLRLGPKTAPRDVLQAALDGSADVDRFELHEPPLAEIFRQAVGEAEGTPGRSRPADAALASGVGVSGAPEA